MPQASGLAAYDDSDDDDGVSPIPTAQDTREEQVGEPKRDLGIAQNSVMTVTTVIPPVTVLDTGTLAPHIGDDAGDGVPSAVMAPSLSGLPTKIEDWPESWRDRYEERAAIMQFHGELSREEAQHRAEECIRLSYQPD